ncbi:hypothetical protein TUM20985_16970 [Mycobacterium antarcticum]|nr:hypothetical protein TUM20985_16970 [Mycolicibacterium sp. TUM20985]GLP74502.1 hypothetical protein TUM20983_16120 [Mycolicibacterium sp. TUM20983]GLP80297.1 hypothetical protein TUM20984_17170 [Mycolicibacterium sp. TUM20984]
MVSGEDAVPGDDILDVGRVEADPRRETGQAQCEQSLRVHVVQASVEASPAAWRAHGVEEPGVGVHYGRARSVAIGLLEKCILLESIRER